MPRISLRTKMSYCPAGSFRAGCVDLENGDPSDAFVTANGHVVFFDHKAGLVEMDSAGRHVADIGGLGTEPGSYRRVTALGGSVARTFTMWDPYLDRLTIIKPREPPRTAWVKDERVEAVLTADTFVLALSVPLADKAGERVPATIAPILPSGRLSTPIAMVTALATTTRKWNMRVAFTSFHWPRPLLSLGTDGTIAFVPPDTVLRVELYGREGKPHMLITGELPFPSELVTQREIDALQAAAYQTVRGKPMPPAGTCDSGGQRADSSSGDIGCTMVRHFELVGKRSPRVRPPVTDIVSVAPHGFWIRTSRIRRDSATWLIADSSGRLVGSAELKVAERPIGRHQKLIAIADSTGGRTSVSWREVIQ